MSYRNDRHFLTEWYSTCLGHAVTEAENNVLEQILPVLFGYYFLKFGQQESAYILKNNRILNDILLDNAEPAKVNVFADYTKLPFPENAIDAIFLPHVLEFELEPAKVLQEAARVLLPEGYLIIIGFNPCSLLGVRRFLQKYRGHCQGLWNPYSLRSLRCQLRELNIEVVYQKTAFYRLPCNNKKLLKHLKFMDVFIKFCFPFLGSSYIIIGQKKVFPLSPIRLSWRLQLTQFNKPVITPTSHRSFRHDNTN